MKLAFLALFLAAATALPVPDDDGGPVDVIINGVPEGEALDLGDILNIKVKEHVDGKLVSATDVLHPYTAQGIAEAAAAAAFEAPKPEPEHPQVPAEEIITPEETIAEPIVLPEPAKPELDLQPELIVPEAPVVVDSPEVIVLPESPVAVNPEPVIPEPATPEVIPEPVEDLPAPVNKGEVYNDGLVQVTINKPDSGVIGTLQSWMNMVINYVGARGTTASNQIV